MPSFNAYAQSNPSNLDILNIQDFYYGTTPKQPVAEQNQTLFAYFDGVGGTGPEYIDGTAYFIKYLIDTEGNIVNPEPFTVVDSPQAVALYNLKDNFEVGKNATVKLIESDPTVGISDNSEILQGTHRIAHVGRIVPILVTETGPAKSDYITTMSFIPPPPPGSPPVADVSGLFRRNISFSASKANAQTIDWQNEIYGDYYTFGGTTITITTSSFGAGTRIKLKASLGISTPTVGATFNSIKLTINRNTTVPGDNIIANSGYIPIEAASIGSPKVYTVETGWIDASVDDRYRAFYDFNGSGIGDVINADPSIHSFHPLPFPYDVFIDSHNPANGNSDE
jgi:predicted secreted protein